MKQTKAEKLKAKTERAALSSHFSVVCIECLYYSPILVFSIVFKYLLGPAQGAAPGWSQYTVQLLKTGLYSLFMV